MLTAYARLVTLDCDTCKQPRKADISWNFLFKCWNIKWRYCWSCYRKTVDNGVTPISAQS